MNLIRYTRSQKLPMQRVPVEVSFGSVRGPVALAPSMPTVGNATRESEEGAFACHRLER